MNLKQGDKVRVREGAFSMHGYSAPADEIRTVQRIEFDRPDDDFSVFLNQVGARPGNWFRAYDLVPVHSTREEVRAGDTVTVTGASTGGGAYRITGVVWEPSHSPGTLWVGPVSLGAAALTITDHQPAPKEDRVGYLYDYLTQRGDEALLEGLVVLDPEEARETLEMAQFSKDDILSILLLLRIEE